MSFSFFVFLAYSYRFSQQSRKGQLACFFTLESRLSPQKYCRFQDASQTVHVVYIFLIQQHNWLHGYKQIKKLSFFYKMATQRRYLRSSSDYHFFCSDNYVMCQKTLWVKTPTPHVCCERPIHTRCHISNFPQESITYNCPQLHSGLLRRGQRIYKHSSKSNYLNHWKTLGPNFTDYEHYATLFYQNYYFLVTIYFCFQGKFYSQIFASHLSFTIELEKIIVSSF